MEGNTRSLRCKEGVLDGQPTLRCLCPSDLCNDGDATEEEGPGFLTNFQVIQICLVVVGGLFGLLCVVCSVHQINNTR